MWAAVAEWGATASCCTPALFPEKFISDRRLSRPRRALEVEAHVRQPEVHLIQVGLGAIQVDQIGRQG